MRSGMMKSVVTAMVGIWTASFVMAQSPHTQHTLKMDVGTTPLAADLAELNWLVGRWVGKGLGGECEEVFLPAWNDSMTGAFRYARDGKLVFSEFFTFAKQDGGVVLKLKHFNPDFTGWEEKDHCVEFPLIKLEKNAAYFGGLTYQLTDDGVLNVWVAMRNQTTQTVNDAHFEFRRAEMNQ